MAIRSRKAGGPSDGGNDRSPVSFKASVNGLDKADVAVADRLLAVVTALVEGEAPDAPSAIQNEAVDPCGRLAISKPGVHRANVYRKSHSRFIRCSSIRRSGVVEPLDREVDLIELGLANHRSGVRPCARSCASYTSINS